MVKVVTALLVLGAAASVVAWAIALCHENRVCPFTAAARFVRGLPWGGRLAVVPLFAALIVYGSVKPERSGGVGELGGNHGIDGTGTNISSNRAERVDRVDGITECGDGLDRIDKIDGIGDVESPQISTNLHKSICVDECGFVDCNLAEQIEKDLHVSTSSTRLENTLRSSATLRLCVEDNNGLFDFMVPSNAVVCEDWRAFGAFEDWFYLTNDKWSFRFG